MIPYMWDRVKPLIQKGLDRGSNYTLDDIFIGLCDQSMQLWVAGDIVAALVTSIQTVKGVKQCTLLVAGGTDLDDWVGHIDALSDWARDQGCEKFKIYGRIGWARKLGFNIIHTEMERDLWQADLNR
jgi:hypothetical protein